DQVGLTGHDVERDVLAVLELVMPADGLDALLIAVRALEGAVDDGALLHNAVAIFPAHRDVEHQVERPERLEAFRLAPNTDQPRDRYEFVNQVELLKAGLHVVEADELESVAAGLLGGERWSVGVWREIDHPGAHRRRRTGAEFGRQPIECFVEVAVARGHNQIKRAVTLVRSKIDNSLRADLQVCLALLQRVLRVAPDCDSLIIHGAALAGTFI